MSLTSQHYSECWKYTNGSMELSMRLYSIISSTVSCWNAAHLWNRWLLLQLWQNTVTSNTYCNVC